MVRLVMRVLVPFEGRVLRLLVGSFVHVGGVVARRLSSALLRWASNVEMSRDCDRYLGKLSYSKEMESWNLGMHVIEAAAVLRLALC
jgi:hypothetical protein